ncbi:isopentenyl phosphate kinase family protein [Infirmifilum lucidum]|uniref:Isopentenyl phosphate kinase n=1 Tax=Infirmifilum lucidum TaxID=2776706 RepID=A0A7L9FFA5_9CREN|nr:isopentenyl phosphate kinase [Infirmifilum lucidum]QOJ78062.1 isopentenyl phosphate kinase family protein [Infirmifilum lucidum]
MLAVIKLGGSVVTEKTRPYTLREDNINLFADKTRQLYNENIEVVIVHGGGSFGHPTAAKYSLGSSEFSRIKAYGFAETRYWMSYLNLKIIEELLSRGVPAISVQTSAIAQTRNRQLHRFNTEVVNAFLERMLVPVLYGDAVIDVTYGVAILSGDDIAAYLAQELRADVLVYLIGSGGVYDRPPGRPDARLLREIRPSGALPQTSESALDVTGGLRHKLSCAFSAARSGVRVAIGGLTYLREMVLGQDAPYTRVLPE